MKIGIITLHKVINYGSFLQAYALKEYLKSQGHEVEIIDYYYPNSFHKKGEKKINLIKFGLHKLYNIIALGEWKKLRKFRKLDKYLELSISRYRNIKSLMDNKPKYDLYLTGSDQVWNWKTLHNDPIMFCEFAPQGSKIASFSASFTNYNIPIDAQKQITKWLDKYYKISVREKKGVAFLRKFGFKSYYTCDPTLLINEDSYKRIEDNSFLNIKNPYILIYYLDYAFNPEPNFSRIVNRLVQQKKIDVYLIGSRNLNVDNKFKYLRNIGPEDFLFLIKNASIVITSSFHGLMFSLIYRKLFYCVYTDENDDSRIYDVLQKLDLLDYGFKNTDKEIRLLKNKPYSEEFERLFKNYVDESKMYLRNLE